MLPFTTLAHSNYLLQIKDLLVDKIALFLFNGNSASSCAGFSDITVAGLAHNGRVSLHLLSLNVTSQITHCLLLSLL